MRIAVVQHQPAVDDAVDLDMLRADVSSAAELGADTVVIPCLPVFSQMPQLLHRFRVLVDEDHPGISVVVPCARGAEPVPTPFGFVAFRNGDACLDADGTAGAAHAYVWQFTPESELQAEGLLEYAIGVSLHHPGLVIIVATGDSLEQWPARGSAIVHLGSVIAEAGDGEDVLVADLPDPTFEPAPPGPRPVLPPILAQRLAAHQGRKIVPPWPADMS